MVFFVQKGMYCCGVLYTKHENFNNICDVSFFFVCLMYLFCVYAQNIHKSSVIFLSVCASGLMVRVLFWRVVLESSNIISVNCRTLSEMAALVPKQNTKWNGCMGAKTEHWVKWLYGCQNRPLKWNGCMGAKTEHLGKWLCGCQNRTLREMAVWVAKQNTEGNGCMGGKTEHWGKWLCGWQNRTLREMAVWVPKQNTKGNGCMGAKTEH